eukprot:TRINITY_DN27570_c0_g2_i1.p1 TRINITY_DN27570_c0_g2~~TRINITY_DN27570_c0_g2_i1.p1  ORF type:complete len:459 (-),score=124.18 TRINITY_DN27570_c0_g2_i1:220-1596(-)
MPGSHLFPCLPIRAGTECASGEQLGPASACNPAAVAFVQAGVNNLLIPRLARWLLLLRGCKRRTAAELIFTNTKQVGCTLMLTVMSTLVAPLLSVLLLSESCLRYYLSFETALRTLLDLWDIGSQGTFRAGFCSRTLINDFTFVWLTSSCIHSFVTPSIRLLRTHPFIQTLPARLLRCHPAAQTLIARFHPPPAEQGTLQAAQAQAMSVQLAVVGTLSEMLTLTTFGVLVPPLLLLAPLGWWLQLCALDLTHRHTLDVHIGSQLASQVLVQIPATILQVATRVAIWAVAVFVLLDFKFGAGPTAVYIIAAASEVVLSCYRWKRRQHCKHCKQCTPEEPLVLDTPELKLYVNPTQASKPDQDPEQRLSPSGVKSGQVKTLHLLWRKQQRDKHPDHSPEEGRAVRSPRRKAPAVAKIVQWKQKEERRRQNNVQFWAELTEETQPTSADDAPTSTDAVLEL